MIHFDFHIPYSALNRKDFRYEAYRQHSRSGNVSRYRIFLRCVQTGDAPYDHRADFYKTAYRLSAFWLAGQYAV